MEFSVNTKGTKMLSGFILALSVLILSPAQAHHETPADADALLVVECLLPGQIRRLGRHTTYVTQRRAIKTTARDCKVRGGEYSAS